MHQKFYIDTDEEISSVIDRLNKSMSKDNYFVVPKRAIFLQSIVNLKLLKREAEKTRKNIILVTQDDIGISMAHRSGIATCPSLEGIEVNPDKYEESTEKDDYLENKKNFLTKPQIANEKPMQDKQLRLNSVGSNNFYNAQQDIEKKNNTAKNAKPLLRRIPVNSTSIASSSKGEIKKESSNVVLPRESQQNQYYEKNKSQEFYGSSAMADRIVLRKENQGIKQLDPHKEKSLEKIFSSSRNSAPNQLVNPSKVRSKIKIAFFIFIAFCLLAFVGIIVYLLGPSAEIILVPNILKNKIELNVHGISDAEAGASTIPISVIDESQDISLTYEVSGKSASSGKKAHGTAVIYNEYSTSPQQLIATTRLESADGKIFRLVKNVVVPGTTKIDGTMQPGAIEVEVVADQAGSDYNIGPADFKIPGFADGPKFDKFYAKSANSFSGGSSDGESNGIKKVTQQDIDSAKEKTENALKERIDTIIAEKLKTNEIILPQAKKITITKNTVNVKVGDAIESLECTAVASVRAFVFSENDIRKILQQQLADSKNQFQKSKEEITKVEYGSIDSDFDNSTLDLKVYGEIKIVPDIDTEQIKKEMLGKNSDQLSDILKKYSSVKSASVEFQPEIISRIPQYARRVSIEIKNEE